MKVLHTLICCFFLSVLGGDAQIILYTGPEGGNLTIRCPRSGSGHRKWFCKDGCGPADFLFDTTEVRAQKGRLSLKWRLISRGSAEFSVSISSLRKSDSGPYRCGSGSGLGLGLVQQVEVVVVDALLDGNPSAVRSLHVRSGETLLVSCFFPSALAADRKYFCQDPCGDEGLLVSTAVSSAQSGRYSIRYVGAIEKGGFLYVSITQLIRSDSGRYGCGLDKRFSEDPYQQFEVIVTDAQTTPEPGQTEARFPSSDPSEPPETTKQSGWTNRDVLLFVGVALVVMVMSLCALMLYRKKTSKPKEPPEETQYADITETSRVYEDIMEDRPVDLSSIYTYVTYSGAGGAGTDDDYSFITAAASSPQNTDGLFSQVNFSNMAAVSSSNVQRGDEEEIIFNCAPLVERSSEDEEEPPLYSTLQ